MSFVRNRSAKWCVLPLVAIASFCAPTSSALPLSTPQTIGPDAQTVLRSTIEAGKLPDLRWPDFSDYRKHLQEFYDSYGYGLAWISEVKSSGMKPTSQAQAVIARLQTAGQKGLSADDYDGPRWPARLAKFTASPPPTEAEASLFDLELTVCVMRYISDLHIGKVNPQHFDFGFDLQNKKYDLPEFLKTQVVNAPDVAAALAQVEPPFPGYRRTLEELQKYTQLAMHDDGEQLPTVKKPIEAGDTYAGVPRMARLLRLVGDLPADAVVPPDSTVYQGALVDAVKKFQLRHGRDPVGRLGAKTIADLNVPLSRRVRQMQLVLERWRGLPDIFQKSPIVVNIPEFRLRAFDDKLQVALAMNVVVGKAYGHGTPVFDDTMQYVVFRPYWNVPRSIIRSELVPKIAKDPGYLAKKGFSVVDNRGDVVASGTVTSDVLAQIRSGELSIRQNPGPANALGLVKFIFPNSHSVYMHDTPVREVFSRSRRDFSHGCIRLEKPADLAAWVLRNNPGWDMDRIRAAMNSDAPQQVNLAQPIPVIIVYGTVVVREDGQVYFYDDIYGYDKDLEKVLDKGYPYPW